MLHYVLDEWFETDVRSRLHGPALPDSLHGFDFVIRMTREDDAEQVLEVLPKQDEQVRAYGPSEKTRLVQFQRPPHDNSSATSDGGNAAPRSFDFLGFTHYWGRSRMGVWVVKRKTAKTRFRRAMSTVWEWCRAHRHLPLPEQHQKLSAKLRGHYSYYGITSNAVRNIDFCGSASVMETLAQRARPRPGFDLGDLQPSRTALPRCRRADHAPKLSHAATS